jgi:protein phosphatase
MLPTQPFDRPSVLWAFESYRRYCWTVHSLADLKLAPFHLLASEGKIHTDKDHVWHMTMAGRLCAADPDLLLATPYKVVELGEESSQKQGIAWWEELTAAGGEGIVVSRLNSSQRVGAVSFNQR